SGLSKEFKVGALAIVSLTLLILGYNYMMGKDNPFQRGREFTVLYDSTQGLSVGTPIIYNGYRIGQLTSLRMMPADLRIRALIEISSDMEIPADSRIKINNELLGGTGLTLLRGRSSIYAQDGDTLASEYTRDVITQFNDRVVPLANSADSLFASLNQFMHKEDLHEAVRQLPIAVRNLQLALSEIRDAVAGMKPGLTTTSQNVAIFSQQLPEYSRQISETLASFRGLARQMDTSDLANTLANLSSVTASMALMMDQLENGEGTAGKLIRDERLYQDLVKSNAELHKLILDLKMYPAKYVPVPGTKKQRKSAVKASAADSSVWTPGTQPN
ncbi:MAG: MlaD family protein, partial [Bacteroidia bacterium]